MRFGLGREDCEALFLGLDGEADEEERRRLLDTEYPKATAGAVQELRTRGLDASASVLDYLVERKSIPAPTMEGGRRRWTAADIDRAAEVLDAEGAYVPGTVMRQVLNLDPAQDERARRQALAEHPEVVPPGHPGVRQFEPPAVGRKSRPDKEKAVRLSRRTAFLQQ